jgi:glycosyltransferase involved in cell wall biosynthesis
MKVCMLISKLSSGGAERVATTLANHWSANGWEVTIITLANTERDFYTVSPTVKRIALNKVGDSGGALSGLWNNLSRIRALRQALKRQRPDIALACIGTDIVAVGSEHLHPPMSPMAWTWAALRRLIYPRLAAVSALTEESAAWIRANTGAHRVPVMPNPIPYPLPDGDCTIEPAAVKQELGGEKLLLAVGRLAYQKAFDRLLKDFSRVQPEHPEWRLVILGEGPLRESLERQRNELGLSGLVAMPGAVSNIGFWYSAADAYVMTSRFEGFGNTLAEALAYGLPSIAVDCETGPRDILRHDLDGLLVPQNDSDALAAALDRLMGDTALRERFAERAVEARERFAVERIAAQWEVLFREVKHGT